MLKYTYISKKNRFVNPLDHKQKISDINLNVPFLIKPFKITTIFRFLPKYYVFNQFFRKKNKKKSIFNQNYKNKTTVSAFISIIYIFHHIYITISYTFLLYI